MVRTTLLVAILVSPTTGAAPAAAGKRAPATRAQLKRAIRVIIQYLPPNRNPKKKTRLVLTKRKQIGVLARKSNGGSRCSVQSRGSWTSAAARRTRGVDGNQRTCQGERQTKLMTARPGCSDNPAVSPTTG